jgi:choline-sulfatase
MKKFLLAGIGFLLLAMIIVLWVTGPKKPTLTRIHFSILHTDPKIEKKDVPPDTDSQIRENIPLGRTLTFKSRGSLILRPEVEGRKGIFFTFKVISFGSDQVKTTIYLKRKKKEYVLKNYLGTTYYHSFVKELTFLKDDAIGIELRGNGTIVVNRAVAYDVLEKEKRSYVFIIALDTLRHDKVGFSRNGVQLTPNISRFKKDCCDFFDTYAQSNWTLPSFMSFFTGLYEFNHQVTRDTSLEPSLPFLIEALSKKFFTVNFNAGLWLQGKFGFSRGFDFFSVISSPTDSRGGEKLFDRTIHFLKNTNVPSVLMFLHTYQIHSPYAPPEEFLKKLAPPTEEKKMDSFFYKKQFRVDIPQETRMFMEILYDAEILAFDHFFGEFIASLKDLGIYEQSMIIFLSDHGEEFYEHGGWAHCHSMYNEVIRVPLFIKFPGNKFRAETVHENVGLIDILPTVMDFYQIKMDRKVDGMSLMPLLEKETNNRSRLFSSTSVSWLVKQIPPKFAILDGHFKAICHYEFSPENLDYFSEFGTPPETEKIQFFDVQADPNEISPVSHPQSQRLLNRFRKKINDIKNQIDFIVKKNRSKNVILSDEDQKKLKSLGYL